ncbi:hypothetical protein JF535_05795 [Microbulbifer salipaludis]|uniref:Uncharacterized protein n=1 Tax=Microbulbifer salipaludis TaxID=187980 RepID=A0ABS3E5H5_9GAMM|nr:hypothetical protein [Microbulbifer salipaludis]MBN8430364.1 hypothetical protein [Microbulbifer salipaludis]
MDLFLATILVGSCIPRLATSGMQTSTIQSLWITDFPTVSMDIPGDNYGILDASGVATDLEKTTKKTPRLFLQKSGNKKALTALAIRAFGIEA